MSTRRIDDLVYGPVVVKTSGKTIHVEASGRIIQGDGADVLVEGAITENSDNAARIHNNTYLIDGQLIDQVSGIYSVGAEDRIEVGRTGSVFGGFYGVWMRGNSSILKNYGEISGGNHAYGVKASEISDARIANSGMISGDIALAYYGEHGTIVNGRHGMIIGDLYGIEVYDSTSDEPSRVVNHGLIVGSSGTALRLACSQTRVVNDGVISGNVAFVVGKNTFDDRGGVVKGSIYGGTQDDTLITDTAKDRLTELAGNGEDTVKATVTYTLDANVERLFLLGHHDVAGRGNGGGNLLRGNDGRNALSGFGGDDRLVGGQGNDALMGGDGGDTFVFATGYGKDTIKDFLPGAGDFIDLSDWKAVSNFAKLLNHASAHGGDVWITAGDDTLVIENFQKADLSDSSNEFLF